MKRAHRLDLTGEKYGRWNVHHLSHTNGRGEKLWWCRCQCGTERAVKASSLRAGKSTSCGCGQRDAVTTHGMTRMPTFRSWETMKQRCLNPNAPDYAIYGGRGIRVCDRWLESFETFLADMGERPEGCTLDRVDVDGDYTPENCRWATRSQQQRNKRCTEFLTHRGGTKPLIEWADFAGVPAKVVRWRISRGWSVDDALSKPVMPGRGRKRQAEFSMERAA